MDCTPKNKALIIRYNLVGVGRMAIKSLIDRACFENLTDKIPEVINFCNIIENVLYFCCKGGESIANDHGKHPWKLILKVCKDLPKSCVAVIERMENLKNNFAKLRAWIRLSLLEKRFHEYLEHLTKNEKLLRKFYSPEALLLAPEFGTLFNTVIGLTAIDFDFDLKGEDLNHVGYVPVDYTPYLRFIQSPLGVLDDLAECDGHTVDHEACPWKNKFMNVETKLKTATEQKGYLEEVVRVQEGQMGHIEGEKNKAILEMKQLENVILELQVQITLLHEQYKRELSLLTKRVEPNLSIPSTSSGHRRSSVDPPSIMHQSEPEWALDRLHRVEPHRLWGAGRKPEIGHQEVDHRTQRYMTPPDTSPAGTPSQPSGQRGSLVVRALAGKKEDSDVAVGTEREMTSRDVDQAQEAEEVVSIQSSTEARKGARVIPPPPPLPPPAQEPQGVGSRDGSLRTPEIVKRLRENTFNNSSYYHLAPSTETADDHANDDS